MMLSGDKMKVNSKMSHEAAEVNIFFKKEGFSCRHPAECGVL